MAYMSDLLVTKSDAIPPIPESEFWQHAPYMGTNADVFWKQVEAASLLATILEGPTILRSEVDLLEGVKVSSDSVLRLAVEYGDFPQSFVNYSFSSSLLTDWEEWIDDIRANPAHVALLTSAEVLDSVRIFRKLASPSQPTTSTFGKRRMFSVGARQVSRLG
ncbi:hypothetical protein F0562_025510 [Nyssa sinensis]|uniref:Uncharacterized protein n=1 Tax=Nyssa sinensis TaxID=561372 RepID=A0A5J5BAM4_9ASTE|nr:hypothetical protein F0562_025510 [Nyssa sinensis]